MGKQLRADTGLSACEFHYYRATAKGRASGTCEYLRNRNMYLHDVLDMCRRGIWERELRQFMPAVSLKASVDSLLALGLIECVASPRGLAAA